MGCMKAERLVSNGPESLLVFSSTTESSDMNEELLFSFFEFSII